MRSWSLDKTPVLTKHPDEGEYFHLDFRKRLTEDEVIVDVLDVKIAPLKGALRVTDRAVSPDGKFVQLFISSGAFDVRYQLDILVRVRSKSSTGQDVFQTRNGTVILQMEGQTKVA